MKELTVNEIIKSKGIMLHKEKINLIVAPAGSGKTYYIFNTLLDVTKKSVYLCDTSNLQDSILKDKEIFDKVKGTYLDFSKATFELDKYNCIVMTYAKWFYEMNKPEYAEIETIVCDEIHNLYKYKDKFDKKENKEKGIKECKNYENVIVNLHHNAKKGIQVIGFTATHDRIRRDIDFLYETLEGNKYNDYWNIVDLSKEKNIRRLRENFVSAFNDISQINYWFARTNLFKYGKKALIYTDRITTAKEIECYINETFTNLNAISLWSMNNENHQMNKEQKNVRNSVLTTGLIPEPYNILIINGSYETGINILDKDIEIVIINNSSIDTIIQARSRVRKDIELLMYRVSRTEKSDLPIITVPEEYLNRKLTGIDKKELIKLLDLRDSRKRLLGWSNFKKILLFNQYEVKDGHISINKKNDTRISEIKDKLEVR